MTREELRQCLWSPDTFVDFDEGVNTAIKKLRMALGDSSASPIYIETVSRYGYRFIAPVSLLPESEKPAPLPEPSPDLVLVKPLPRPSDLKQEKFSLSQPWLWLALAFGLMVLVAVAIYEK